MAGAWHAGEMGQVKLGCGVGSGVLVGVGGGRIFGVAMEVDWLPVQGPAANSVAESTNKITTAEMVRHRVIESTPAGYVY